MFKREVWFVPIGMWVLCAGYTLLAVVLRAYYVDAEGVRQAAALAVGPDRGSTAFWSGHAPLGTMLVWLIVKPLSLLMPVLEATQLLGALAMGLTGLVLFRLLRLTGLGSGLCGWLTFLFLTANVALVSATMLGFASLALLLMALWVRMAVGFLLQREVEAGVGIRVGLLSALLGAINLFALLPALALGVLVARRRGAGVYWVALLLTTLVVYLGVYFAVLPAQVQMGGVERPKPSLITWLWTVDGGSVLDPPTFSGIYWQAAGEQVQNALLALGRPFRVRDVYQYFLGGGFITLLKGAFLLLLMIFIIMLFTIRVGGERVLVERPVRALRQLAGWSLLLMVLVILLWQGDRQACYLWAYFWAIVALAGWLASYTELDTQRVIYVLPPLALVMALFGLIKMSTLRLTEYDSERQEAEAVQMGVHKGDILLAAGRLAELLRYYTAGRAQVIATEYWQTPDTDFQQLLERARQQKRRVIIWDYALNPDYYRHARTNVPARWLTALERAQQQWRQRGGAYLRSYSKLVAYPTMLEWTGEVQTLEP
ncbi:MAG: hypothetical protein NZL85_05995 [Fimbriimonadales bacterium]|nr:hypothetical protein [Fimbriimonadales bacterium]